MKFSHPQHLFVATILIASGFSTPLSASNEEIQAYQKLQPSRTLVSGVSGEFVERTLTAKEQKKAEKKAKKSQDKESKKDKAETKSSGSSSSGCFAAIFGWASKPENQEKIKEVAGKVVEKIEDKRTEPSVPVVPAPAAPTAPSAPTV